MYAYSTSKIPLHSELKISPIIAKKCNDLPIIGGISAPNSYAGIFLLWSKYYKILPIDLKACKYSFLFGFRL
jgi:hypothetical protein